MLYYMNMTHSITITKPTVGSVVKVVTDHSDYFRTAMPYVAAANRFCTTSGKVVLIYHGLITIISVSKLVMLITQ